MSETRLVRTVDSTLQDKQRNGLLSADEIRKLAAKLGSQQCGILFFLLQCTANDPWLDYTAIVHWRTDHGPGGDPAGRATLSRALKTLADRGLVRRFHVRLIEMYGEVEELGPSDPDFRQTTHVSFTDAGYMVAKYLADKNWGPQWCRERSLRDPVMPDY